MVKALNTTVSQVNATTFDVPYRIVIKNTGTVAATNLQAVENLSATFAAGNPVVSLQVPTAVTATAPATSAQCALNASFNGTTNPNLLSGQQNLPAGGSCTITFSARVVYATAADIPSTAQNNSVVATSYTSPAATAGATGTGVVATDTSTAGTTPPLTPNADTPTPTPVNFAGNKLDVVKAVGVAKLISSGLFEIKYSVVVGNVGTNSPTVFNAQANDNLVSTYASPATFTITNISAQSNGAGATCTANSAFNGNSNTRLLDGSNDLAGGQSCVINFTVLVNYGVNLPPASNINTAYASGMGDNGTPNLGYSFPGGVPTADPNASTTDASVTAAPTTGAPGTAPAIPLLPSTPNADAPAGNPTPVNLRLPANLSGRVFNDINHDRAFNGAETGQAGITVQVIDGAGNLAGTAVTAADGSYTITGLTPGVPYNVRFLDPNASGGNNVIFGTPTNNDAVAGTNAGNVVNTGGGSQSTINADRQNLSIVLGSGDNLSSQSLPLDPSGVVYDSITRAPIANAVVTLIGPNGLPVPAVNLVGGNPVQTTGATGFYQFLLQPGAPAGIYTLSVAPPSTGPQYIAPSTAIPAGAGTFTPPNGLGVVSINLSNVSTAPQINEDTRYFFSFNLNPLTSQGVVNNHIPLDPRGLPGLMVTKVGNRSTGEIGDVVTYTVQAKFSAGNIANVSLIDNLPAGFRYMAGTAKLGSSALADPLPSGNLGPQLIFNVGTVGVNAITVTYKVRIGVGAQQGDGINRVRAQSGNISSNTAQYKVRVTGGVFTNDACVVGKVYVDCNNNHMQDAEELGIPGVRMYMQDGTYLISDVEGKYSYCGISPRTHVLKVDAVTLPRGSRMTTTSNRNAGDGNSLFLDIKNGELHRADFAEGSCSNTVLEQVKARRTGGEVRAHETEKKSNKGLKFEGKDSSYPQQGTDSANQPIEKPREGECKSNQCESVQDIPVNALPNASGNTRGSNLRNELGGVK